MKYFWEISVSDYAYDGFVEWLGKCEDASLTFAFAVIRRYEGHRLLYGFSNFEILEDFEIDCFDFEFSNDDILYEKFKKWKYESECFLVGVRKPRHSGGVQKRLLPMHVTEKLLMCYSRSVTCQLRLKNT